MCVSKLSPTRWQEFSCHFLQKTNGICMWFWRCRFCFKITGADNIKYEICKTPKVKEQTLPLQRGSGWKPRGLKRWTPTLYEHSPTKEYFFDRSTKLRVSECVEVYLHTKRAGAGSTKLKEHKVTSKQADSRVNKVNSLAVIDGRSHAELCDNVEH